VPLMHDKAIMHSRRWMKIFLSHCIEAANA